MKPTVSTNNPDIINYLNSKNTFSFTPKSIYPGFNKTFNFASTQPVSLYMNSPKNMAMPIKPINDTLKQSMNGQKMDNYNAKEKSLRDSQTFQPQSSGYGTAGKYSQKTKTQNYEKRSTPDKSGTRSSSQEYSQTTVNPVRQQQISRPIDAATLKENNRLESDSYNRNKKLEINTDIIGSYNGFRFPSSYKTGPSSTKNKDNEKLQENPSKNIQPYSSLEFMTKFNNSKPINNITAISTTENTPLYSTNGFVSNEVQDDKQNLYQQQKQLQGLNKKSGNILNKFFSQVDQPKSLSPLKKKNDEMVIIQNNNNNANNNLTPKNGLRINNFFSSNSFANKNNNISSSTEIKKNEKLMNKIGRFDTDSNSKPTNYDEEFIKKTINKSQSDIKNALKNSISDLQNYTNKTNNNSQQVQTYQNNSRLNTIEYNKTDNSDNVRLSQQFNTRNTQYTETVRSSSQNPPTTKNTYNNLNSLHNQTVQNTYHSSVSQNNSEQNNQMRNVNQKSDDMSSTNTKPSLNNFITKVNKGDIFTNNARNDISKKSQNGNSGTVTDAESANKKSLLLLDDKLFSKTPKANMANSALISKSISRSTTNAESQSFVFGNNTKNLAQSQQTQDSITKKNPTKPSTPNGRANMQNQNIRDEPSPQRGSKSQIYYMSSMERYHRYPEEKDYFAQIYREHFMQTFQAMTFCKILRPVDPRILSQKKVMLNKRETHRDKKTIVFDLDETLIHCNESLEIPYDVKLPIRFPHGEIIEAGINIRPYALECLKELSQYFEIIVFTASHGCYANVVLDYLDPKQQYIHHRLFRESCVQTEEGIYIKDLRVLGNRNLNDVVIVDNAAYSFGYQLENGIPIIPYYDNKGDQELKILVPYLKYLNNVKDVKEVNKSTFKLHLYCLYDAPEKVLEKVILSKN